MIKWWGALFRCGSAMLALLVLQAGGSAGTGDDLPAQPAAAAPFEGEEPWLKRSRDILNRVGEEPAPEWLRREATREALNLAEETAARSRSLGLPQDASAGATASPPTYRILIFGSFSIPETTLRALLQEATQPNVVFVLRGIPRQANRKATIRDIVTRLKGLIPAGNVVPNVMLDPTLFRRHGVETVPTLVLEREGKPLQVVGAVTVDWLRRQAATVAKGQENLGRRAESYAIAEKDLILEMQERLAGIDWSERRRKAIEGFWRKPQSFVQLPDAREKREFWVDPSVRVTQDLRDADGAVLINAGETFNPLNWAPLSKTIVVFRGTDARHLKTAAEVAKQARASGKGVILLTTTVDTERGWRHLDEMERELVGTVYLLPANLAERFHLKHIPATVVSRGAQLLVTELPAGVVQ